MTSHMSCRTHDVTYDVTNIQVVFQVLMDSILRDNLKATALL